MIPRFSPEHRDDGNPERRKALFLKYVLDVLNKTMPEHKHVPLEKVLNVRPYENFKGNWMFAERAPIRSIHGTLIRIPEYKAEVATIDTRIDRLCQVLDEATKGNPYVPHLENTIGDLAYRCLFFGGVVSKQLDKSEVPAGTTVVIPGLERQIDLTRGQDCFSVAIATEIHRGTSYYQS